MAHLLAEASGDPGQHGHLQFGADPSFGDRRHLRRFRDGRRGRCARYTGNLRGGRRLGRSQRRQGDLLALYLDTLHHLDPQILHLHSRRSGRRGRSRHPGYSGRSELRRRHAGRRGDGANFLLGMVEQKSHSGGRIGDHRGGAIIDTHLSGGRPRHGISNLRGSTPGGCQLQSAGAFRAGARQ